MEKIRWQQIITITDLALAETSEDNRLQVIRTHCGDDMELQKEVIAFLKSINESDSLWNELSESNKILSEHMVRDDSLNNWLAGLHIKSPDDGTVLLKKIGLYDIKKHIGSGGMGEVFLAGRTDGDFHQNVALKLIRAGIETTEQTRLFLRERKILSSLNHPNIARLLDGGVAEDGRPYYVMEFVDGLPITEYCNQHGLILTERLTLFIQVCKAVQYAHSNFIVHRDIKPDNLLVNRQGIVKVLDFGIAKMLIDHQLTDQTMLQTREHQRKMSLSFAAPEQITLDPVTTATDVYALGLLLYELLTNERAFNLKGKTLREAEYIIRHIEPEKPSSVASKFTLHLKGDLDAIVLKTLRKEPSERYGSAKELLDDVERYLFGQPIKARPASKGYYIQKFIRRNKLVSALAAILILIITSSVLLLLHQQAITMLERDKAILEAQKSEQLTSFLVQLYQANDPEVTRGQTLTARDLLDQGAHQVQNAFLETPVLRAEMLTLLGNLYREIGEFERSYPILREALSLSGELDNTELRVNALSALGSLHLMTGQHQDALIHLEEAESLLYESGLVPGTKHATVNERLILTLFRNGRLHDALERAEEVIQTARYHPELPSIAKFDYLLTFGNAMSLFPWHLEQAEEALTQAMNINLGEFETPGRLLSLHSRLLNVVGRRGDLQSAQWHGREAVLLTEQVYPEGHIRRAEALLGLSMSLFYLGYLEEAEEILNQALIIVQEKDPEGNLYLSSSVRHYLGLVLRYLERFDEAEAHLKDSLFLTEKQFGRRDFRYAGVAASTGDVLRHNGNQEEGIRLLNYAAELRNQLQSDINNPIRAGSLDLLIIVIADFLIDSGQAELAVEITANALNHLNQIQFNAPCWMLVIQSRKGKALHKAGQFDEARQLFQEAVEMGTEAGDNAGIGFAFLYEAYANFIADTDHPEFTSVIHDAIQVHERMFGNSHPSTQRLQYKKTNRMQ